MDPLTEVLQIILPLVHFLLVFTCFGWAVGIRTRCRELIEKRLAQICTKRAIKEALRAPAADGSIHPLLRIPAECIAWLRISRLRRLGGDDRIIRFWGKITDIALLLFPVAELICAFGKRVPVCAWIASGNPYRGNAAHMRNGCLPLIFSGTATCSQQVPHSASGFRS